MQSSNVPKQSSCQYGKRSPARLMLACQAYTARHESCLFRNRSQKTAIDTSATPLDSSGGSRPGCIALTERRRRSTLWVTCRRTAVGGTIKQVLAGRAPRVTDNRRPAQQGIQLVRPRATHTAGLAASEPLLCDPRVESWKPLAEHFRQPLATSDALKPTSEQSAALPFATCDLRLCRG